MKPIKTIAATLVASTALGATIALAAHHLPMVGGAEMYPDRTIVENASTADNLTTLVAAVQAAGLVDTLSGEGPFTVFAPTNDAFAALPEGAVEDLLKPENLEQLQTVLGCHVVQADAMADAIRGMVADDGGMHPVTTVGGCRLMVRTDGDTILIEDENGRVATVTQADVDQSNGVVHVIDTVILPAS
ncbi:MAG: fasciclin domain-containing protein [Hyphomicrobiaceae bacterium]|nr:fasciclin domain-containing protein [Hyphomicrobiaceae bacterium]